GDLDRGRGARRRAVVDDLDVVAVRVEQERGVVAGMVGAQARRAVVPAPGAQTRVVHAIDGRPIGSLKRQVRGARGLAHRRGGVHRADDELVAPEEPGSVAAEGDPELAQDRQVEALAALEIQRDELEVIDEPSSMELLDFHETSHSTGSRGWRFLPLVRISALGGTVRLERCSRGGEGGRAGRAAPRTCDLRLTLGAMGPQTAGARPRMEGTFFL